VLKVANEAIPGSDCTRKRRAEVGSPFHKTLLSSKTCGFKCCANHTSPRTALCQLPSVVKDLRPNHLLLIEASPRLAERCAGLEPHSEKNAEQQKTRRRAPGESVYRLGRIHGA